MKEVKKETIHAKGIDIGIYTTDFENEFISLTDIAKYRNVDDPRFVIQNWMRNRNTIEFLAIWETLHNPDFNRVQFDTVKNEAGLNRFVMTPLKWIEQMNAKGIVSKAGRYGGGTFAHSDIALAFASWISPEFQLYIMKDYRRLKYDENSRLSLNWNLNREISKLNYRIHTDAIKKQLIPLELTPEQISYKYASEADMLNVVLFGMTAKQWRDINPKKKGNIRDDADLNQLLVLANMESYNAILISQGKIMSERIVLLRELAVKQMETLSLVSLEGLKQLPGGGDNASVKNV
ncbi:MAG: KilA-N domain-containing protein [Lachnospiraceae bacterium]|nr:KilA-N domain-containing protein [Lachnospiraceae bacterium]